MLNVKRWIIEAVILSLVFAGVGYAAHETKFSGLRITDLTASRAVVTDGEKDLASSATTATEIGYVSGLSSAVQTQLDVRCLESVFGTALSTGITLDGTDLKVSTTLQSLTGLTETNGGIPYGTADNAYAWLAAGTANYLLQGNGAGAPSWTNTPILGATAINGVLTVKPDGTSEVLQVNDGSLDLTDGNAGTTGTLTVDSSGNLSYNKSLLITTGTLHGAVEIISDDNSLSAAQCYGSANKLNGAETTTLPAAVAGMSVLLYSDDATKKTIDPNGTDHIWLNGADLGAGVSIDSPAAVGDFIVLIAFAANNWYSLGQSGTWVVTP